MEIFLVYLFLLFSTTILGESLITFTQDVFIYGIYPVNWLRGLPKSLLAATLLASIIAFVAYFKLRPTIKVFNKLKAGEPLSDAEKLLPIKSTSSLSIITAIGLSLMYVCGNVLAIYVRTLNGVINVKALPTTTNRLISLTTFVQTFFFGLTAIEYCTEVFLLKIQKYIKQLGIEVIPTNVKEHQFTKWLGIGAVTSQLFGTANMGILVIGATAEGLKHNVTTEKAFIYFLILLVVDALCFYPMAKYMFASLRTRLNVSKNNIKDLTVEGDLTKRQTIETTDGFGMLNSRINELIISLQGIISNIKNAMSIVDSNASELIKDVDTTVLEMETSQNSLAVMTQKSNERSSLLKSASLYIESLANESNQISQNMQEQSAAVEQNSSSVTQMVANIESISEMVVKAKHQAEVLLTNAVSGEKSVNETSDFINQINEKSTEMQSMLKVIQDVASQTNLLAMNAAIEAAHAGESGKGFAVVAGEIRKLAESTATSTKTIKIKIEEIVDLISESTLAMNSTKKAFGLINESVDNQTQIVQTISNAMEEQSIGASETLKVTSSVAGSIVNVNNLIQEQTHHISEVKLAVDKVLDISNLADEQLLEVVKSFDKFDVTLTNIKNSTEANKQSVADVEEETRKFKVN